MYVKRNSVQNPTLFYYEAENHNTCSPPHTIKDTGYFVFDIGDLGSQQRIWDPLYLYFNSTTRPDGNYIVWAGSIISCMYTSTWDQDTKDFEIDNP